MPRKTEVPPPFNDETEVTTEWVQSWTDKGEYVNHIPNSMKPGGECYFLYHSRSGRQPGWFLFCEHNDGDETQVGGVKTRGQLRLFLAALDLDFDV